MFHWQEPLTPGQVADIVASKAVIYEGFKAAVADTPVRDRAGILVDEKFGVALLRDAAARGYVTCVSTEKSGQDQFDFEYGDAFARHIATVNPTFAKVLVRYNPEGDAGMNARQPWPRSRDASASGRRSSSTCVGPLAVAAYLADSR